MFSIGSLFNRFKRDGSPSVPPRRAASSPYEAAGAGRRIGSWKATRDAINAIWNQGADQLIARSRDIVRKDGWAAKAVEEWVCNAIGTGIKPQSLHPNPNTKDKIQKLWLQFVSEADVTGTTDFYGLEALAFRSMVEGGECFVRKLPATETTIPVQLQLIEPEQSPFYLARPQSNTPAGHNVRCGIEFDRENRRTAYYFLKDHPGERFVLPTANDLQRVPASEIMHLFRPLRPGQLRGLPWLANALVRLWELDQYDDAELLRKKFAAMMVAFIIRQNPEEAFFPIGDHQQDGSAAPVEQDSDGPTLQNTQLEAGMIQELEPGEEIKFNEPADVGGNYESFERIQLLRIAAGAGISYEMLTGDHSKTNFSSIRAGILSFRRLCEQIQYCVFIHQFCRPTWRAFIEGAVLAGKLDARDYAAHHEDYLAVEWHTPKWAWVDPEKDVKAEILAIRAGLKARSMSINEMGMDEEEVDRQIARDNERADEYGHVFDSDPRKTQGQLPSGGGADSERDEDGADTTAPKRGKERTK